MCLSRSQSQERALHATPTQKQIVSSKRDLQRQMPTKTPAAPAKADSPKSVRSPRPESPLLAPDPNSEEATIERLRWREFGLIYIAYMNFLLVRKNYGFWLPAVLSDLGAGKSEAGLLGSTFEIVYGSCALLNGVLIDCAPPKLLLAGGLLLAAGVNVCIGYTGSLPVMVALWGFNGFVQSFGWPSITNIFLAWFPKPETRGAMYSLLSTCQNAGAALVPLLVSAVVARAGWRGALYAPAAMASATAVLLLVMCYGSPAAAMRSEEPADGGSPKAAPRLPSGLARRLTSHILLNKALWLMALNYFCISLVRTSLSDWSTVFLREAKGLELHTAARCLFMMETGGFAGSLAAGWMSDRIFGGRRGPVVCICTALIAPGVLALLWLEIPLLLQIAYAWLGFCAFPVHVLLGLFSREVVPANVSSSAGGFVKCIAQVGGAFAGYPLGLLQQRAGWEGVFGIIAAIALGAAIAATPLWSTTALAQMQIKHRHGTVNDFNQLEKNCQTPARKTRE